MKILLLLLLGNICLCDDHFVTIVTKETYQDVVVNSHQDVLLKVYAPWCGHCKHLAPTYESLAKKFTLNPNVVIAEIDWTTNQVPGLDIRGYPTVKFFKKGGLTPQILDYNQARTVEAFEQFVKTHTSHPWVDLEVKEEL